MPEGHCNEEVLFASGYEDKLSTYVTTNEASRTREILGYADAGAARSTFRALRDAVANCAVLNDSYSDKVAYAAEVYGSIDEANAQTGITTFTFAYTSTGSDPFGVLYQFAIVDDVLYGSDDYGDWTTETAREGVAVLNEENGFADLALVSHRAIGPCGPRSGGVCRSSRQPNLGTTGQRQMSVPGG